MVTTRWRFTVYYCVLKFYAHPKLPERPASLVFIKAAAGARVVCMSEQWLKLEASNQKSARTSVAFDWSYLSAKTEGYRRARD